MAALKKQRGNPGLAGKFLGLLLFLVLLALGLVGLVLPVIPGLPLLLLALLVLAGVSPRFAVLAGRNTRLRRALRRMHHARTLPLVDLLQLSFWVPPGASPAWGHCWPGPVHCSEVAPTAQCPAPSAPVPGAWTEFL